MTHHVLRFYGHLHVADLRGYHLQELVAYWKRTKARNTMHVYAQSLRRFARWLERCAGAMPGISDEFPKFRQAPPRTISATLEERSRLLLHASPGMRFFLHLCVDLGLRHATAYSISLSHWNPNSNTITFRTKGNVEQTLPLHHLPELTETLRTLQSLNLDPARPIVAHLHTGRTNPRTMSSQWFHLKKKTGVRSYLRIHDLRRTAAELAWEATKDLRAVQALLGHSNPLTTGRYLRNKTDAADLDPVLAKMQQLRDAHTAAQAAEHRAVVDALPPKPKEGFDA